MNRKRYKIGIITLMVVIAVYLALFCQRQSNNAIITGGAVSERNSYYDVSGELETGRTNEKKNLAMADENVIVYQRNQITVCYIKADEQNIYLTIENNYGKSLLFESDGIAVNGCMLNLLILERIDHGEKADIVINWREQCDDKRMNDFTFNIFYSEDGNGEPIDVSELITIKRKKTKHQMQLPETKIYHKDGVKIFYSGMKQGIDYKAEASLTIQNNSGEIVYYSIYEGMINGRSAQWYGEGIVFPNCIAQGYIGTDDMELGEIDTAVFHVIINKPHVTEILTGANTLEVQVKKDE